MRGFEGGLRPGYQLSVIGYQGGPAAWSSVIRFWLSGGRPAAWLLVIGYWLFRRLLDPVLLGCQGVGKGGVANSGVPSIEA